MFSDNWTGSKNGVSVCVLNIDVYGVRVCVTYQCECMVSEKSTH